MAGPNQPGSRIVRDRFGRAWRVAYTNPDRSEYGSMLRDSGPASHHRSPGSHHHRAHHPSHAVRPQMPHAGPSPSRYNAWSGERVDPRDGMADSPLAQALFHSRAGANQWDASYRLVRNATAVYSSLIFLALFAPEIAATAQLSWRASQAGMFGPATGRLFWSGGEYLSTFTKSKLVQLMYSGIVVSGLTAQKIASEAPDRLETLETTPVGQWIESVAPECGWLWSLASKYYAEGAEEVVTVVQGDMVGTSSVWARQEYLSLFGRVSV